jgi:hypothetical protein
MSEEKELSMKERQKQFLQQAIKEKDELKLQYSDAMLMYSINKASGKANFLSGVAIVLTLVLIGIAILSFTHGVKINANDNSEIGRYKIKEGPYRLEDMENDKVYEFPSLFLLDTATGEVQRYSASITPTGTYMEGWVSTEFIDKASPFEEK